jgi:type II secretory pathway component GspD/PulD (secretin)
MFRKTFHFRFMEFSMSFLRSTVLILLTFASFAVSQTDSSQNSGDSLHPIHKIPVADSVKIPVLDFKNSDIRDVLRGLGMQYNVNIYIDPDVNGMVSLYLVDVTVKNAIDFIVKRNNLAYTVENSIVKVYRYQAPPPPAPPKPKVEFHLSDGTLTIDLKDVLVKDVARMFSDSAQINVIADGSTDKTISARLVKIKPDKAIKALFEPNGFEIAHNDGIYYVSPRNWNTKGQDGSSSSGQFRPLTLLVKDEKVSLEVDNASLDQLIRSISVQSGINIVIYDKLTGDITAKLKEVPIDNALRFLLQNTKFTFWKDNSIYFIGSREMNQQKTTIIIPLRHVMADEANISKILPPSINTNAVVKYDKEHNSLVVIGSFDVVAEAQEFIAKIDRPIPQVLIEALVVDLNLTRIRAYGVKFFTQILSDSAARLSSNKSYFPSMNWNGGKNEIAKILNNLFPNYASKTNRIITKLPSNFRASIEALENANLIKVHSTPQIATINGNSASITIGETRYYKLKKDYVNPSTTVTNNNLVGTDERFESYKFNTQLQVTPWVMDDGYVMVKIRPEFNIPRTNANVENQPPNVDTRVLESMVRLKNGQTIVLGGQRQTENSVTSTGIPFLSNIPILGWLFSNKQIQKTETQMMIFLTPHIYYGDDNSITPDNYYGKEVNKVLDEFKLSGNDANWKIKKRIHDRDSKDTTTVNNIDTVIAVPDTLFPSVRADTVSKNVTPIDSTAEKKGINPKKTRKKIKEFWPFRLLKKKNNTENEIKETEAFQNDSTNSAPIDSTETGNVSK